MFISSLRYSNPWNCRLSIDHRTKSEQIEYSLVYFNVLQLFLFLFVSEISFVSLGRIKVSSLLTNKILCTAYDWSVKMRCGIVSALNQEKEFFHCFRNLALRKTVHSICACPSISIKQFCHRQTDWVYVGENVKLFLSFHIIFNNWVVKI